MRKIVDTNNLMMAYAIVTAASCLLMPNSLGLAPALGMDEIHLPIYSWISELEKVAPFYRDYFTLSWLLFPVWLAAFGWIYAHNYSSAGVNVRALALVSLVIVALLAFMLFGDMEISEGSSAWRQQIVVVAARNRFVGAMVFGGAFTFIYALAAIALVKMPIDAIRNSVH